MGSVAKRLGQIAARSIESESSQIVKTVRANKIPGSLGQLFDTTLKESHDMRVFGLGTLRSMASLERYGRFTTTMHGVYSTMESELDQCSPDSPNGQFWEEHQKVLRRTLALEMDLADANITPFNNGGEQEDCKMLPYSTETHSYIRAIQQAGSSDRSTGGVRLLGHAYCRYLADIMGGQALGAPTRMALGLPRAPRHYQFAWEGTRKEYVESLYQSFNRSGEQVSEKQRIEGLEEAKLAFEMNIRVYAEEPLWMDSAKGAWNIVTGFARGR